MEIQGKLQKSKASSLALGSLVILWILAAMVSLHGAAPPLLASFTLWGRLDQLLEADTLPLELRRSIQGHYLSYGVYIPLDDIVVDAQDPMRYMLESACGQGRALVWVPLKFHIPLVGEKVFEWCLVKA